MRLTFFGAAHEVGRSCIMVESSSGTKILLDAGVKLGEKEEYPVIGDDELKGVEAIVVTHAHLDHSGYIAHIASTGWNGAVYSTKPTFELTSVLINDYMKISNPENVTKAGLARMGKLFKFAEYHKPFRIKDLEIKLFPAGHILGSAMIEVKDGSKKLLYTGDFNMRKTKLLDPAYTRDLSSDTLITESTYGGAKDIFPPLKEVTTNMVADIKETLLNGGKVIIPSFAVGRAQEILLILDDYLRSGKLPTVPLYMDGMIKKAMKIHRHNVMYCRDELQKRILMSEDDPFKSKNFVPIESKAMRSKAMSEDEASIIVTTSGMITGGPVVKYLQRLASIERNKLILVGYQALDTKGRELQDGAKEIELDGRKIKVNMSIKSYHFSAHADRNQLLRFMTEIKSLRNVFIVHGEENKSNELYDAIKGKYNAKVPLPKETVIV